ncbi:WIAG-tail domain, partial [Bacillus horti]
QSVTEQKLADQSVTEQKLADQSVTEQKLADQVVTEQKLGNQAVTEQKLADQSVTEQKLGDLAVTSSKIRPASIHAHHLQGQIIANQHLMDGSITFPKLAFQPVISQDKSGPSIQQYGVVPFEFTDHSEDAIEILVQLNQPFADEHYVIVANTNHQDFYAVIVEQTNLSALIKVVRLKASNTMNGLVNWIAMGTYVNM